MVILEFCAELYISIISGKQQVHARRPERFFVPAYR